MTVLSDARCLRATTVTVGFRVIHATLRRRDAFAAGH